MSNLPDELQPRALCTLLDVTKRVPGYDAGDNTEIDDVLSDLILQESRDFMEATKREITSHGDTDPRVFDVDWFVVRERELQIGDASTITAISIKQLDGTLIQTLTAGAWVTLPRIREDWQPISSVSFPWQITSPASLSRCTVIEITGTWGFPLIPDTVRRAVATLTIFRYLNDTAAAGTQLADAANAAEFNLAASLRAAFDARDRLRIPTIG